MHHDEKIALDNIVEAENAEILEECNFHRESCEDELLLSDDVLKAADKWGDRYRVLGSDALQMMLALPSLLQSLQPTTPNFEQSPNLCHKFNITCIYAHLLKSIYVLCNQ